MSKIVFLSLPAHGHINPTLGFVKELITKGNEVIYYATENFKEKIEQTGAIYRGYDKNVEVFDWLHTEKHNRSFMRRLNLLLEISKVLVPQVLAELENDRPDQIIHDSMCIWGKMISKKLGYPAVCSVPTFALHNKIRKDKKQLIWSLVTGIPYLLKSNKIIKQLGTDLEIPAPEFRQTVFNYGELNIIYTSRYFQPSEELFDDEYKFVGPSIKERHETSDFPFDRLEGKKVIYASMGTVFNDNIDIYRATLKAFKDTDYVVVLSIGNRVQIEALGEIPENFIVSNYVPQLEILKRANLFITHGGMNSVSEAVYYGVPLVVIPQTGDQPMVADRIDELEAGINLKGKFSPKVLKETAETVLNNDLYVKNVKKIGESFTKTGGSQEAAEILIDFVKSKKKISA